jgi:hypothetical protein
LASTAIMISTSLIQVWNLLCSCESILNMIVQHPLRREFDMVICVPEWKSSFPSCLSFRCIGGGISSTHVHICRRDDPTSQRSYSS